MYGVWVVMKSCGSRCRGHRFEEDRSALAARLDLVMNEWERWGGVSLKRTTHANSSPRDSDSGHISRKRDGNVALSRVL